MAETLSRYWQNVRTIELIEAVQGNAGVGLTRGDVDEIVEQFRAGHGPAVIADWINPGWRITTSRVEQNAAVNAAAAIHNALTEHFAKWAEIEGIQ